MARGHLSPNISDPTPTLFSTPTQATTPTIFTTTTPTPTRFTTTPTISTQRNQTPPSSSRAIMRVGTKLRGSSNLSDTLVKLSEKRIFYLSAWKIRERVIL